MLSSQMARIQQPPARQAGDAEMIPEAQFPQSTFEKRPAENGPPPAHPSMTAFGPGFRIDLDLCDGCGLCVEVCPADVVLIKGAKACVSLDRHELCYKCGACLSVCMQDAISRA